MALVPEGASFLMHLDLQALMAAPAFSEHRDKVESSELGPLLKSMRDCKLGPEAFERVAAGYDAQGHQVLVLRGAGVGKEERWECLASVRAPWPAFTARRDKKTKQFELRTKGATGGRGLVVDEDTVLLSDGFWWPKVQALVNGNAKPAIETQLRALYSNAPIKHQFWFRGDPPAQARARLGRLAPSCDTGLEQISGGLNLDAGMKLEMDAIMGSADLAKAAQRELSSWLEHLKGTSPMFGLPKEVMQRATLNAQATLLRFRLDISGGEWNVFQRNLSRISAGSRNAPSIPDMFPRQPVDADAWKDAEKPKR